MTVAGAGDEPPVSARGTARPWTLGVVSVGFVLLMVLATGAGSYLSGTAGAAIATPVAVVATVASLVAVATGIAAIARDAGRIPGIVGLALGIPLNPVLLALALPTGAA